MFSVKNKKFKLLFVFLILFNCEKQDNRVILKNKLDQFVANYCRYYPKIKKAEDLNKLDSFIKKNYQHIEEIKNPNYELDLADNSLILYDKTLDLKVKTNLDKFDKMNFCEGGVLIKGFFSKDYLEVNGVPFLKNLDDFLVENLSNTNVTFFDESKIGKKMLFKYENSDISLVCNHSSVSPKEIKKLTSILQEYTSLKKNSNSFDYALLPLILNYN